MITRTARQIITDSLKLIGALAGHEVAGGWEQHDAFLRLQELLDSWGTHAQTMYARRRVVVPVVANQQTYTIGIGGDVDVPRPMDLEEASYITDSNGTEIGAGVLTTQEYTGIPIKELSGALVSGIVYDRTPPLGTIWVYPSPTQALDLVIYYSEPVQEFPDLGTAVALEPGYAKAIRYNLAVELCPEWGRVLDPLVERGARESLADIKRANVETSELVIDPGLPGVTGSRYNIVSDS